ncbi:MAG: hypothetical protein ACE5LB_16980, partial [Acidiferrobacterales bacterium]
MSVDGRRHRSKWRALTLWGVAARGLHGTIVEKQEPGSTLFGFTPHYEVLPIRQVMGCTPL